MDKEKRRLLLMVDTENLWMTGHEELGENTSLDYKKLLEKAIDGRDFAKVEAKAFVPVVELEKTQSFISSLGYLGYGVEISPIIGSGGNIAGTDIDTMLVVDAIRKIDSFDVFALASGDSDFAPLLEFLNEKGKTVEVLSFESGFSGKLRSYCTSVKFLGIKDVYKKNELRTEKKSEKI